MEDIVVARVKDLNENRSAQRTTLHCMQFTGPDTIILNPGYIIIS